MANLFKPKNLRGKYFCEECNRYFKFSQSCEHDKAKREANLKKFHEQEEEEPEDLEVGLWAIARRLQYVYHVRRVG
jgi:hypothetical protein